MKRADLFEENLRGKVVGFTSGVFDLLHPLHVLYLEKCKAKCDYLIVLLDSDSLVQSNPTKKPLFFNQMDRAYMLEALEVVNWVTVIDDIQNFINKISLIRDTFRDEHGVVDFKVFKNSREVYNTPTIEIPGTELVIIEDVERFSSTTEIKNYIIKNFKVETN